MCLLATRVSQVYINKKGTATVHFVMATCAFVIHDLVLCYDGSSFVVQELQLIPAEVSLVSIATSRSIMSRQHT